MIIQRHDLIFARRAIRKGIVSGEEMLECIGHLRKIEKSTSLKEILVKFGYTTLATIKEIEKSFQEKQAIIISEKKTILGGYLLLKKIGEGAMGSVYRAEHKISGKIVALKLLDQELAEDKTFISRFLREARNAAKLKKHPNIVEAYDIGQDNGRFYFVMEFVDGCSLAQIIYQKGKIPERQALIITKQLSQALNHAHRFSIVHRDVKPENILYSIKGTVKLCDLGLAKDLSQDIYYTGGITIGTACYASPEQLTGSKQVDIRTDIYSLGICLYQMLSGELPFNENAKQKKRILPDIRKKNPNISIATGKLLGKMAAIKKQKRHQNPGEILRDINCLLNGKQPNFAESEDGEEIVDSFRKSQVVLVKKRKHFVLEARYKIAIFTFVVLLLGMIFVRILVVLDM